MANHLMFFMLPVIVIVMVSGCSKGRDGFQGIIFYEGRPVCSRTWNRNDARVFCRLIHPNATEVEAFPHLGVSPGFDAGRGRESTTKSADFKNVDFRCDGSEKDLNECPRRISSRPCGADRLAGVACLARRFELRNGSDEYEGDLFVGGVPVVDHGLSLVDNSRSDMICENLFGRVSKSTKTETFRVSKPTTTANLGCGDAAKTIDDCDLRVDFFVSSASSSAKQLRVTCSPCKDVVILDEIRGLMKVISSTDDSFHDAILRVAAVGEWLKTECNVACDSNREYELGGGAHLQREGIANPRCLLDFALEKIGKEYEASLSRRKPDSLNTDYDWIKLLRLRGETQSHESRMESLEELSYLLTDFQPNFIDLVDFWSVIDADDDPIHRDSWREKSAAMTKQLDRVEESGSARCSTLGWRYSSNCNARVKSALDRFRKFLDYMKQIRDAKQERGRQGEGRGEGRGEGEGSSSGDREAYVEEQLSKFRGDYEEKYRQNWEKKIERLYKNMYNRMTREEDMKSACDLFTYLNGGEEPAECRDANSNRLPVFPESRYGDEMCSTRELKKRSVIIPAAFPTEDQSGSGNESESGSSGGSKSVEKGVVNLKELSGVGDWNDYVKASSVRGRTELQIPDVDWLIKHGWVSEEERDRGPFFLREFVVLMPPLSPDIDLEQTTTVWTDESPLNGKVYTMAGFRGKAVGGAFVFGYGDGDNWENPYDLYNCEKKLDGFDRNTASTLGRTVAPNVFSPFQIKYVVRNRYPDEIAPVFFPAGKMYLQARIQICFGPSKPARKIPGKDASVFAFEFYPRLSRSVADAECCGEETNAFFDQIGNETAESCPRCPGNSEPRLNGYYCERCPAGTEPTWDVGCLPCKPGFFKAASSMDECQSCGERNGTGYGNVKC